MKELTGCRKDRFDGWRVEAQDPVMSLVPFVLRTRLDSQILFEQPIPVTELEAFVRKYSPEIPGLTIMHVILAALVRLFSLRPCLNRFIVHNKLYAHKDIKISIAIKRQLSDEGAEALIKPVFSPYDTLADVVSKTVAEIEATKPTDAENSTDKTAKLLAKIPSWLKRPAVNMLFKLDNVGMLPKPLYTASPWHTSLFLTNVGSVGIDSIYHHLYEFGTCSIFVAMGKKGHSLLKEDDTMAPRRSLTLRFVTDERICDGHYYGLSMRWFSKLLLHPEKLLEPPKQVNTDPELLYEVINRRRAEKRAKK